MLLNCLSFRTFLGMLIPVYPIDACYFTVPVSVKDKV